MSETGFPGRNPKTKRLLFIVYDLSPVNAARMRRLREALPGSMEITLLPVVHHAEEEKFDGEVVRGSRRPMHLGVNPKRPGSVAEAFVFNSRLASVLWHSARADLVVSMGVLGGATMAGAATCRILGKPHLICCQTLPEGAESKRHPLIRRLKRFCLDNAHGVVSQSPSSEASLRKVYGVPTERIRRSSYSAGLDEFEEWRQAALLKGREECRKEYGFDDDQVVMTYAGNYLPFKGIGDILHAMAGQREQTRTLCVFVGHEEPRHSVGGTIDYFSGIAARLGVSGRCRFLPEMPRRDLAELYLASDVVMLPSHRDTYGKTIAEAASLGRPTIVTDNCGCAGALVLDGVNGYVVPAGNISALQEAMGRLEDRGLREQMGSKAVEIARLVCDPKKEIGVLSTLIEEVLQ